MTIEIHRTADDLEIYRGRGVAAFRTGLHIHHDCHQLVWVEQGVRTFRVHMAGIDVGAGTALFIPAGMAHGGGMAAGPCTFRSIYIPRSMMPDAPGSAIVLAQSDCDLPALFTSAEVPSDLADILHAHGRVVASSRPVPDRHVRWAQRYLESHLDEKVSLDDLSRMAGLSKYELLRRFGRIVGIPPHAYQLQRRVERAKALLRSGVEQADIACTLGFADQSHLARNFRRIAGVTPAAYRGRVAPG